ncbi:MAG: TSUP family transporter [Actinomycetota bacterium]|nr:TSUP family transporter [Actinomycetota bacterium]
MATVSIGVAIGIAAGVLSGLFGIGGGILIVPALVFSGLTQHEASGTSLAALVFPVGLLGLLDYAHRHQVRMLYAVGLAIGLTGGALIGSKISGQISNEALSRGFGVLLLAASIRFLFFVR